MNRTGKVNGTCWTSQFEWEIKNFCIGCKSVGESLYSPDFTTKYKDEDIKWYLACYPKGKTHDSKEYLWLYLHCRIEITAIVTFIIFNGKGELIVNHTMDKHLFVEGTGYGTGFPRSQIQSPKHGVLDNDKVIIVCKITYVSHEKFTVMSFNEAKKRKLENEFKDKARDKVSPCLEDDYEVLLQDGKFSDASLISEGKLVKVHKNILASRSEVFAEMFNNTQTKKRQKRTFKIDDVRYDVLMEVLRFVYCGKINGIDDMVGELADAADKYALNGLKIMCENTMRTKLSQKNVIEYLQIAEKFFMDKLKNLAIELIIENANDISQKPDFSSVK